MYLRLTATLPSCVPGISGKNKKQKKTCCHDTCSTTSHNRSTEHLHNTPTKKRLTHRQDYLSTFTPDVLLHSIVTDGLALSYSTCQTIYILPCSPVYYLSCTFNYSLWITSDALLPVCDPASVTFLGLPLMFLCTLFDLCLPSDSVYAFVSGYVAISMNIKIY